MYKKLLEVQKKVGALAKDKKNPFFNSNYLDINNIVEVVKPILNDQGLIILQPIGMTPEGRMTLTTVIIDSEEGSTRDSMKFTTILPENPDPQKMGAIITYFRRYAIQSLLFLQAEDTDANDTKPQQSAPQTPKNADKAVPFGAGNGEYVPDEEPQICEQCSKILTVNELKYQKPGVPNTCYKCQKGIK